MSTSIIRCKKCNKKCSLDNYKCKCNEIFCLNHRLPFDHNCNYNYKIEQMKKIENNNPIVKPIKLESF